MEKAEMEAILNQQVVGLADFTNGYKACAKTVLESFDKKKENNGTGTEANTGNSPVA